MKVHSFQLNEPGNASFMVDDEKVYLKFDPKYDKYLDTTNYDGPMVYLIALAMSRGEPIEIIGGKVSYKLYKNVTRYIMSMLKNLLPDCKHIVKIICQDGFIYEAKYTNPMPKEVGCALSCGADSSCCLEDYYFNYEEPDKITIAANFDAGADIIHDTYDYRLAHVTDFVTQKTNLDMFAVGTNFHKVHDIRHHKVHVLRNLSVPLFFQPLFKKFYYASGQSYPDNRLFTEGWKLDNLEVTHLLGDPMIIPLLSTYTLEFELHGSQYKRYEKIYKIAQNPIYNDHLNVCVTKKINPNGKYVNCSKCSKCIITLCALDHYNLLEQYSNVFDINLFKRLKRRNKLRLLKENPCMNEIFELRSMLKKQ